MKLSRRIIFVGAGTAGHVEPALAVARVWMEKYPDDHCIFLGTPTGLENTLVPAAGFDLQHIEKVVMPRSINPEVIKVPFRLMQAVMTAKKIVEGTDLLVGFGGYASASAYLAARLASVPFVVHEANAVPGWANRLGALLTPYLAVARPVMSSRFSHARVTGLPLRADVRRAYQSASRDWHQARMRAKVDLGWSLDHPTLLILGGSLGSSYINSQIIQTLPFFSTHKIQILHSVGAKNPLPDSDGMYRAVPYIEDMATAYLAADVVIARSGAVTCAEFGALGRMAVFVPLPIGNGEQARNADKLVSAGRAIVLSQDSFSKRWLEENIEEVIDQSKLGSESGLGEDIQSEERIVDLMENALRGRGI